MMQPPKVTVLMGVYNGQRYLRAAIDSILQQTFTNFEFLIIDDGSKDASVEIIKSYSDPRIRLLINEKNIGLAASLNRGINSSTSRYIARMDCDDISLPQRLEKQVAFLEHHSDIGICGSGIEIIGKKSDDRAGFFNDDAMIRSSLIFDSGFAHPAVMISRQLLHECNLRYDETFTHAQDYDLWARAAAYTKFANLPETLLRYRVHAESAGRKSGTKQRAMADRVRRQQLARLGIQPLEAEYALHHAISTWQFRPKKDSLESLEIWFEQLIEANDATKAYPALAFRKVIADKWFYACNIAAPWGLESWGRFQGSPLSYKADVSVLRELKFLGKCLLKRNSQLSTLVTAPLERSRNRYGIPVKTPS